MSLRTVRVSRIVDAPIATVWDMVADARRYKSWTGLTRTELEREGSPQADGVGAIRNFGVGPKVSREEVVAFDEPTHFAYVLLNGLPLDDYEAHVRLTSLGERRTRVTWEGQFSATGPKQVVMTALLHLILNDFVRRLAKRAPLRADRDLGAAR